MRRIVTAFTAAALALSLVAQATPASALTAGYDSSYAGESAFLTLNQGQSGTFTVFFLNTGATTWTKGTSTQVDLAACLEDKVTCNAQDASEAPFNSGWLSATRYASSTQSTVGPGQVGTFTYNVAVPAAQAAGTYRFNGDLVKADTGDRIHPEGYFQDVTVPTGVPAGAITVSPDQNTPDRNTVSVGTTTNANRGAHTYTATIATSVTATCVDLQLIRSGDYTPSTGAFRDNEEDAGGTIIGDNRADLRSVGAAVFEVVNGVAITPATRVECVTIPSTRTITFTIDSTGVADTVRPVVFDDTDNDNQIDLKADNTSSETSGVGGSKTWDAAESDALANALDGCVTQLDKTAKNFTLDVTGQVEGAPTQCANPAASTGDVLYEYDANDQFFIAGVPSTITDFEGALSRGDAVTVGAYASSPEPTSTFNITGDGPALTSCTAEKGSGAASDDIKITINPGTPDYDTDTIGAFYTGFRIQRAPNSTGTDENADGLATADMTFATIATSTVDEDANTKTVWEYTDKDVSPGVYRYRCAGIVDGDTGPNTTDPTNESSVTPGAADATAPTSTDLFINQSKGLTGQLDAGDAFKVVFSETMNPDSVGDVILVQDADGTTMTIRCTGDDGNAAPTGEYEATCSFNTATENVKGTDFLLNRVLTVVIHQGTLPTATSQAGTTAGMQLPTTVIDQGGIVDTTGNQWNVTGSSDRVIDIE